MSPLQASRLFRTFGNVNKIILFGGTQIEWNCHISMWCCSGLWMVRGLALSRTRRQLVWCNIPIVENSRATRSCSFRSLKDKLRLSRANFPQFSRQFLFSFLTLISSRSDLDGFEWTFAMPWVLTKLLAFPSSSTEISSTLRQGPTAAFDDRENGSVKFGTQEFTSKSHWVWSIRLDRQQWKLESCSIPCALGLWSLAFRILWKAIDGSLQSYCHEVCVWLMTRWLQAEAVYHGLVQLAGWRSCECNGQGFWDCWENNTKIVPCVSRREETVKFINILYMLLQQQYHKRSWMIRTVMNTTLVAERIFSQNPLQLEGLWCLKSARFLESQSSYSLRQGCNPPWRLRC